MYAPTIYAPTNEAEFIEALTESDFIRHINLEKMPQIDITAAVNIISKWNVDIRGYMELLAEVGTPESIEEWYQREGETNRYWINNARKRVAERKEPK